MTSLDRPADDLSDERRDLDGYRYLVTDDGWSARLTECCGAVSSFTGGGDHVCKSCYEIVDLAYGNLPNLDGEPDLSPPIVIDLGSKGI